MADYELSPVWGSACRKIPRWARRFLRDIASPGSDKTTKLFVPAEVLLRLPYKRWGLLPGKSDTRSLAVLAEYLASVRPDWRPTESRRAISDLDPYAPHR